MPNWHYHANHVDAPARGSKAAAMKDARALRLYLDMPPSSAEDIKQHGIEYPLIIRCFRTECTIRRGEIATGEIAAMREP